MPPEKPYELPDTVLLGQLGEYDLTIQAVPYVDYPMFGMSYGVTVKVVSV
ncbi:hypothetical protein ERICIII_01979 [Paenibacillus larvae subsp. larvae]|uniref:Uncharacterized protein n=1 Tax=Paenibacillus larvae subsp. larvae TaxID=147375 RepID=A0A2L1TZV7_9BACL|nr:hypothetical protein ERICIII_01979 [Paenibacillus larvae subsp. larvae]